MIYFTTKINLNTDSILELNSILVEDYIELLGNLITCEQDIELFCSLDTSSNTLEVISVNGQPLIKNKNIQLFNGVVTNESELQ